MSWRNMSYTKKGAIIGGGLYIISLFFYFISYSFGAPVSFVESTVSLFGFLPLFFYIILYFGICGYEGPRTCTNTVEVVGPILGFFVFLLLGVLIGKIIQKIKNRRMDIPKE